ncbi:glyoxylase-like metal-dependent hydrolase (beta-lactamase superfamily II) [Maritalea mobilis]|uniref:Glyoxylase-like metal-dependent hydrolase (Beta-lactamase superfamily II) n=2 Tax=Maritalea mobilis TaxID=483324 RepID=A0A4R6VEM8_9HYPH|nr:glyoxylase-like metal-dependent hydrolase (beta-lactamase superfamily II) [Maritalea mobilis]
MPFTHHDASLNRRHFLSGIAAAPLAVGASAQAMANETTPKNAPHQHPQAEIFKYQIGDIEVIAIADGFTALPSQVMVGLEPEVAEQAARLAYKNYDPNMIPIAINSYIVRTRNKVIAVDAGAPSFLGPNVGAWQAGLAKANISLSNIDIMFLTHMHTDHVAGLVGETGEMHMPQAELMLSETEWAHSFDNEKLAYLPKEFAPMIQYARGQTLPYKDQRTLLSMDKETEIAPGVFSVPLPGHTMGHMGIRVESQNKSLMIWGDIIHSPTYQFSHPEWSTIIDADPALSAQTRTKLLDQAAADRAMVAGMHLDFPSLGYVERHENSYRYVAAPRNYGR